MIGYRNRLSQWRGYDFLLERRVKNLFQVSKIYTVHYTIYNLNVYYKTKVSQHFLLVNSCSLNVVWNHPLPSITTKYCYIIKIK